MRRVDCVVVRTSMLCYTIDIVVLPLDAAVPSTTSFDVAHVLIATAGKLAWAFSTIPWPTNLPVVSDASGVVVSSTKGWSGHRLVHSLVRCESYTDRPSLYANISSPKRLSFSSVLCVQGLVGHVIGRLWHFLYLSDIRLIKLRKSAQIDLRYACLYNNACLSLYSGSMFEVVNTLLEAQYRMTSRLYFVKASVFGLTLVIS